MMDVKLISAIISGIVAIASLLYTWRRERSIRLKETAASYREQITGVLIKISRIQQLSLQPYYEIHPILVDIDTNFSDVIHARDHLWREFYTLNIESLKKINEEGLESCYIALLPSLPFLSDEYKTRILILSELREIIFDLCNATWQAYLLSGEGKEADAKSAQIGNLLRSQIQRYATVLKNASDYIIEDISARCNEINSLNDRGLAEKAFNVKNTRKINLNKVLTIGYQRSTPIFSPIDLEQDLRSAINSLKNVVDTRPCHNRLHHTLNWCEKLYDNISLMINSGRKEVSEQFMINKQKENDF